MAMIGNRRSSRLKDKQKPLVEREETEIPVVKTAKKRKKVMKETEQATTSESVHSSHSESRCESTVDGECEKEALPSDKLPPKRKSKVMNAKERKSLVKYLDQTDDIILAAAVKDDLRQQLLADRLKSLTETLCSQEQLLTTLISCYRKCFTELYPSCKKMSDPMLNFQICWYNQCSAFLLSKDHDIGVLNLKSYLSAISVVPGMLGCIFVQLMGCQFQKAIQ